MGDTFALFNREGGMPWKECHVMDERLRFLARLLAGEKMAPLCAEFGISRKTGYKIYERYTGQSCGISSNAAGDVPGAAHAWNATFTLTSASIDRVGLRVTWRRLDSGATAAGDTRELVMAEGTAYPLDLLTGDVGDRERCRIAGESIAISADIAGPATVAETILDYELWRIHEDGRGGRWSERATASAIQGERVEFAFTPLTWPLTSACEVSIGVRAESRRVPLPHARLLAALARKRGRSLRRRRGRGGPPGSPARDSLIRIAVRRTDAIIAGRHRRGACEPSDVAHRAAVGASLVESDPSFLIPHRRRSRSCRTKRST
jgi:hypothetical protein